MAAVLTLDCIRFGSWRHCHAWARTTCKRR